MLLERRAMMFKHDPFIDGNKVYFYKEGLGFNPKYFSSASGWTEAADHAYVQAGDGNYFFVISLPSTLSLTNVYVDGQVTKPQSNYQLQVYTDNPNTGLRAIMGYTGVTWNNGTTDRKTNPGTFLYPVALLNGQVRTYTLKSLRVELRCYNWYATFTSL